MRLLPALLLLCLAQPALAGQRATYLGPDGKTLTIDVADNGDALVQPETSEQYGLWRDGSFYLVGKEEGVWTAARVEDVAAAFDRVMPPIFKSLFGAAADGTSASRLRMEAKGPRTVSDHEGQVYAVYWTGDGNAQEPSEIVLSNAPELRSVGRVMEAFMTATMVSLAPLLGEESAQTIADLRLIFARGAPLDFRGQYRLASVEPLDVPAEKLALPARPQSVEEIAAGIKISGIDAEAEAAPAE